MGQKARIKKNRKESKGIKVRRMPTNNNKTQSNYTRKKRKK